jgi:hypothetical protein
MKNITIATITAWVTQEGLAGLLFDEFRLMAVNMLQK